MSPLAEAEALLHQGRLAEADSVCETALRTRPGDPYLSHLQGYIATERGELARALQLLDRAAALNPGKPEIHNHRAIALQRAHRHEEALAALDRALALRADALFHFNRGVVLGEMDRIQEAQDSVERALALRSGYAAALQLQGNLLRKLGRGKEALQSMEGALAQAPGLTQAAVLALGIAGGICDWPARERHLADVLRRVEGGEPVPPFNVVVNTDDPALHRRAAEQFSRLRHPAVAMPGPAVWRSHARLRLAYVNLHFGQHPGSVLMAEMFERHDRRRFETFAIATERARPDAMTRRLQRAFDHVIEASGASDATVAQRMRALEIDVAVDRVGHIAGARPDIFARRCAPVQVNFLAYPGTMGAPYLDYLIADHVLVPDGEQGHYTEQLVRLPGSYQCNDTRRPIDGPLPARTALGLPESGFVFGSFNQPYKHTPEMFGVWMRLLRQVPGSVLWLLCHDEAVQANLGREAQLRGVDPGRLVFAPPVDHAAHLSRIRRADLFLDTFPCNSHTTASDALWAGLPLLTLTGRSFVSRVAASLLLAAGLPELVTATLAEYEAKALRLATEPSALQPLRERLARARTGSSLFDMQAYTAQIEWAYLKMRETHEAGLPPRAFDVPAMAGLSASPAPPS